MGSEVADGFVCKPINKDPNTPIMHYKTHIMVCVGERCNEAYKEPIAERLRDIIKDMGLEKGENRVKITKTHCFGACRYRSVGLVYEKEGGANNCIWLKHIHKYDDAKWREIFESLRDGKPLGEQFAGDMMEMEVF